MTQPPAGGAPDAPPRCERIQLIGFSQPDVHRLRLFLERPRPPSGDASSSRAVVVDEDADLLIINAFSAIGAKACQDASETRPRIVIVERCVPYAHHYQVPRDSQLLFSLAQGLNRIRDGWTPPGGWSAAPPATTGHEPEVPVEVPAEASGLAPDPVAWSTPEPDTAAAGADAPGGDGVDLSSLRFIVIDDSLFSREAVTDVLRRSGFHAVPAESGEKAVALCRNHRFDVALVDFEMPGMNGPDTIRRLRQLGSACPRLLIMLTARDGVVDRLRGRFAGADAYLIKPAKLSTLNAVIAQHRERLAAAKA